MLRRTISLAAIGLGARLLLGAGEVDPSQQKPADPPARSTTKSTGENAPEAARNTRPQFWFGVAVEKISPAIARQLKLRPDQGLMVVAVLRDSPAARAGLQAEDLLIELNGKPLVLQEELALAANNLGDPAIAKTVAGGGGVGQQSSFVFLRDGDRNTVAITPTQRPEQMLVIGSNAEIFSPQKPATSSQNSVLANNAQSFTNYVAPNGNSFLIGPGNQIDLQSQSAGTVNIRKAVANGERVILTQETDASGKIHNTITPGNALL